MKLLKLFLIGLVALLAACGGQETGEVVTDEATGETYEYRGDKIDDQNIMNAADFKAQREGKKELTTKLSGKVTSVCKKKGCWMKIDMGDGEPIRVTFKDYGFFMPLDCEETDVIVDGFAYLDTTSVEMLQHFAEDAGKSEEEIAAITEPELNWAFEAHGVILKQN